MDFVMTFMKLSLNSSNKRVGANLPTCREYIWSIDNIVCVCLFWIIQVIYGRYRCQKLHKVDDQGTLMRTKMKKKNKRW